MKKTVLRIFSILFFLIVACTILSAKIETEMLTQVKTMKLSGSFDAKLPMTASFPDEYGMPRVFALEEKTGWEAGVRIRELGPNEFSVGEMGISPSSWSTTTYILTASRVPPEGQLVEVYKNMKAAEDTLLLYYPLWMPEESTLPSGVTEVARTSTSVLLETTNSPQPFMEHQEKNRLSTLEEDNWRIYSLTHANQFFENMPKVALVAAFLLLPVGLWVISCFLARDEVSNSPLIWVNVVASLGCLGGMWAVLRKIDLPASLLPPNNILDFAYYKTEIGQLLEVLKGLTAAPQAQTALANASSDFTAAWIILGGTAALIALIAVAEGLIAKKIKL